MPERRFLVESYDGLSAGATKLATLPDAGTPQFSTGLGGTEACTIRLPRAYGWTEAPGEPGSSGALANDRRSDVRVTDSWSRQSTDPMARGRLIYRGVLKEIEYAPDATALTIYPLSIVLERTAVTGTTLGGDTLAAARTIWNAYPTLVGWDARNNQATGTTVSNAFASNTTLLQLLQLVASASGSTWHAFVSAVGQFRIFDETDTNVVAVHDLRHGATCTVTSIKPSTADQVKKVIVPYSLDSGGSTGYGTATATASDYDSTAGQALFDPLPNRLLGWAQAYADGRLAQLNRVLTTVQATVSAAVYPIDTIEPGDQVRLTLPRVLSFTDTQQNVETLTLRVARITYQGDSVGLELGETVPDLPRLMAGNNGALAAYVRGLMTG